MHGTGIGGCELQQPYLLMRQVRTDPTEVKTSHTDPSSSTLSLMESPQCRSSLPPALQPCTCLVLHGHCSAQTCQ